MSLLERSLALACVWILSTSTSAAVLGEIRIAALRVSFQSDDSPGTTGTGAFLNQPETNLCGDYTVDPPPHDKAYFQSQLKAVDSYFRSVSYNQFGIDLDGSTVFPESPRESYQLTHPMAYYHPYDQEELQDERLVSLFQEALQRAYAADGMDFNTYDLVLVFHAGIGQDFNLPFLDPTPEDIPSTYLDSTLIDTQLGGPLEVGGATLTEGILVPETQNHLLYSIAGQMFAGEETPCENQIGLTGTLALMIGFGVGLPPLWDPESGATGIGIFGLMDQGSNNGRGIIPAPPDAWTRLYAGWEQAFTVPTATRVALPSRSKDQIIRVPIDDQEYFLIENRTNWFRNQVSLDSARFLVWEGTGRYPPYIEVLLDSAGVSGDPNGVVTQVPDYDLGLPSAGLLIWHIDEKVVHQGLGRYSINMDRQRRGVDLEEADGAQDIGFPSPFPLVDPSSGYFGDLWFQGNREYERANPGLRDHPPEFGPYSHPATSSNDGSASYISIQDIGLPGDTLHFLVTSALLAGGFPDTARQLQLIHDFDGDGVAEIIGGGDSLWWSPDLKAGKQYFGDFPTGPFHLLVTNYGSTHPTLVTVAEVPPLLDSGFPTLKIRGYKLLENQFVMVITSELESLLPPLVVGSESAERLVLTWGDSGLIWEAGEVTEYTDRPDYDPIRRAEAILRTGDDTGPGDSVVVLLPEEGGVVIGDREVVFATTRFTSLALVDLDLDQRVEAVTLSAAGALYVINRNTTLEAGFPVWVGAVGPVLARDLLGDSHPELVLQDSAGNLVILNWQGKVVYRLANPPTSPLQTLGEYQGRSAVMTRAAIWVFDSSTVTYGNEWSRPHHNLANDRRLVVEYPHRPSAVRGLMDQSRTYPYPNPVRSGTTTLRIQVREAARIEVLIYDLAGYHVDDFKIEDPLPDQVNEITWNVNGLAAGLYFAKVVATKGGQRESKILKIGVIH